jgi:hypothetical protein
MLWCRQQRFKAPGDHHHDLDIFVAKTIAESEALRVPRLKKATTLRTMQSVLQKLLRQL